MKSFVLATILFFRTQAFSSDVNFSNNVLTALLEKELSNAQEDQTRQLPDKIVRESGRFKIALLACYGVLISVFAGIVYCAILLEPRFPF